MSELENGRLVRLLTKMGFINERPEYAFHLHHSVPMAILTKPGSSPQVRTVASLVGDWGPIHHQAFPGLRLPSGGRKPRSGRESHPCSHMSEQAGCGIGGEDNADGER